VAERSKWVGRRGITLIAARWGGCNIRFLEGKPEMGITFKCKQKIKKKASHIISVITSP